MNILFLCKDEPNPIHGGIERCTDTLARRFRNLGHKVYVLALRNISGVIPDDGLFFFPNKEPDAVENRRYLDDFVKDFDIDILINQAGLDRDLSSLFLSTHRCPKVSVIHADPDFVGGDYLHHLRCGGWYRRAAIPLYPLLRHRYLRRMNSYYKSLTDRSDRVILLSENYYDSFPALQRSSKIQVIPNFTESFVTPEVALSKKTKTVLYVGRLERRQKTPEHVLKAFKLVEAEFPDWKLTMVGDGPDMSRCQKLAQRLNLKNAEFVGMIDAQPYIESSPILCLTSKMEGFPMVLIEAMAGCCVPVSFDSFAAAKDIIEDSETGFLVTPGDDVELAGRLRQLMNNDNLRNDMAIRGLRRVKNKFSPDTITRQWHELFQTLKKRSE